VLNQRGAVRVGRLFGTWLSLHPAFVALAALDVLAGGRSPWWWCAVAAFLLWHELGHALAARQAGLQVLEVEVHVLGGRTELMGEVRRADLFAVYAAGPLASAFLGVVFGVIGMLTAGPFADHMFTYATVNLVWAGLNLLPVYPLDGGHVLRAVLAKREGAKDSAAITLTLSALFALGVTIAAWRNGWWALVCVGALIIVTAYREWTRHGLPSVGSSVREARSRRRRSRFRVIQGGREAPVPQGPFVDGATEPEEGS